MSSFPITSSSPIVQMAIEKVCDMTKPESMMTNRVLESICMSRSYVSRENHINTVMKPIDKLLLVFRNDDVMTSYVCVWSGKAQEKYPLIKFSTFCKERSFSCGFTINENDAIELNNTEHLVKKIDKITEVIVVVTIEQIIHHYTQRQHGFISQTSHPQLFFLINAY